MPIDLARPTSVEADIMEALPERNWTADQSKAVAEVEAILNRAFEDARGTLARARVGDVLEQESCLRCSCEFFLHRNPDIIPGADAPALACMRCRHLYTSHRIF